ncbi:MAG: glycosyltransferase [Acidimicrobiia bacterium]|nr:glycosyltransferase [Acidimicrobiia bacterium]
MSLALLLATELAVDVDAGHDVFGISAPGPYVDAVESLGVTHVPVPAFTRAWNLRRDVAAARQVAAAIRRLDLDVLHTHTPKAGVIGRVLGRLLRVPVVVNTCHGLWVGDGDRRAKRAVVLGIEGLAAGFSHHELFQNAVDREALRWAVPDRKARVVGNGVDLDRFRFDAAARRRVRAEWGVADNELVVGGVGRRVAEKGIVELGVAARALAGRARFVWVGPTDEDKPDALRDEVLGIELIGPRDDMPAVYSALDVFVLPSHREGFSRSGMEAAACGRPMVLSDIRGCRELGSDGHHLLLVPPVDPPALVGAIARLLDDAALRARLGAAAATRAQEAFDQRAVAAASLDTYRQVAARRGTGGAAS